MESRDRRQEVAGADWIPIDEYEKDSGCRTTTHGRQEKVMGTGGRMLTFDETMEFFSVVAFLGAL